MALGALVSAVFVIAGALPAPVRESLPFGQKVETFRAKDSPDVYFSVRLEQPFLADEFEKSNTLRLRAPDGKAYLIFPAETRFEQKHAEFYGRLRGEGTAELKLEYEVISEAPDGSRQVQARSGDISVPIPAAAEGPPALLDEWAAQQNLHFQSRLNYSPGDTFFQYCLLQSQQRYGIKAPALAGTMPDEKAVEADLYDMLTGSLAIQESLQNQVLRGDAKPGDFTRHISEVTKPTLKSLDHARWLEHKRAASKAPLATLPDLARLVPQDQYFAHFNSARAATEVLDLATDLGDSVFRLFTIRARDDRLPEKFEEQLCLKRDALTRLVSDGAVSEVAVTGSDPFVKEGTDLTLLMRVAGPLPFAAAEAAWLAAARLRHPELEERSFNYRGHKIDARYTNDRQVSSFVVRHQDIVLYSNSHAAIRRVIDAAEGKLPRLSDAVDARHVAAVLPPLSDPDHGYLLLGEAFLRRMVGPEVKIAEKRRLQCFNNLVMLNNASLFYRMEYGRSPASLNDLIQGRFVDPAKVICPHGGAYGYDPRSDTCTCSLHNRLKLLTPIIELPVLKVSTDESAEYDRYLERYQKTWAPLFDPIAMRFSVSPQVKVEVAALPLANGNAYADLKHCLDDKAQALATGGLASSAFGSLAAVVGRARLAAAVRAVPGVAATLEADPTLTDLSFLGDRLGVHLCDGDTVLELDPTQLHELWLPMLGQTSATSQLGAALAFASTKLPMYVTLDVDEPERAGRLLDGLASRFFLSSSGTGDTRMELDAYRLPDYKAHAVHVLTFQVYAFKLRLHLALVGAQLVAATNRAVIEQVIDASLAPAASATVHAHLMARFDAHALSALEPQLQIYWAEKARLACHRNTVSIYNLIKLHGATMDEVPRLSDAKYGVRLYCPDQGAYVYDAARDAVTCSVHGDRKSSRQNARMDSAAPFSQFLERLQDVVASLRFTEEAAIVELEVHRRPAH